LPFGSVLKLERRVSHEGMVSVGGNLYSVPDATRKRLVEVHTLADEIRIFENGTPIAVHPVLEGRGRRRVAPGHRKFRVVAENATITADATLIAARPGERVARRSLAVYEAVGRRLAGRGERS
jgi:Mu transposase-like protein